jgi:GNAT superfamily N-acetyltransferase
MTMANLHFIQARKSDLDALALLAAGIEHDLPSRDMFVADGPDFFASIIQGQGNILLAVDESGRIAGASVIRFPSPDDEENLGRALRFDAPHLTRVRHLEAVFVQESFRGCGLAGTLIRKNMALTAGSGRDLSLATIWPGNLPSLSLHFSLGLSIRAFALKYGGKPRFIMAGGDGLKLLPPEQSCLSMDFEGHKTFLARGLVGCGIKTPAMGADFSIAYAFPDPTGA